MSKELNALECLEVLEQDIKDRTILAEDRQLKLCTIIKQALLELQSIKEANPSEALGALESYINNIIFAKDLINQKQQLLTNIATIKNALQRLESVDNSKPSAALKTLEVLDKIISPLLEPVLAEYEDDLSDKITSNYFALKQSLLNAEKEHKALEIIKKTKNIKVGFYENGSGKHYKIEFDKTRNQTITKEEFNLLKEVLE